MSDSTLDSLSVRVMAPEDLGCVLSWRNHPDIRRYMYTQHEISLDEHRSWFERASQDPRKHLLIFEVNNVAQGFVNLCEQAASGIADWGFYVAPEAVKGTGRKLGQTTLDYAFNDLNLHKVCGQALAFNERSIKFHRDLGFQQEGVLRDQHYDGVNYHAVICFGLLNTEWSSKLESQYYAKP